MQGQDSEEAEWT